MACSARRVRERRAHHIDVAGRIVGLIRKHKQLRVWAQENLPGPDHWLDQQRRAGAFQPHSGFAVAVCNLDIDGSRKRYQKLSASPVGVAAPLVLSRRAGSATRARLEGARSRLIEDNATIQAVTFLLLGTLLLGSGLTGA